MGSNASTFDARYPHPAPHLPLKGDEFYFSFFSVFSVSSVVQDFCVDASKNNHSLTNRLS
jgi:hypothetical protein